MKERLFSELRKIKREFSDLVKKQGKEKVTMSLYIVFSLFAITVFGLFAIRPTLATISELHKEKEDSENTLEQLKLKNQALQRLTGQYQQIEGDLDFAYSAIPITSRIPELTRKIETLAGNNNLAIQDINVDAIELFPAVRTDEPLFSYSITITAVGNESSINSFIGDVINFDRILSIERIGSGRGEGGSFSTTITGRAFFIKE